MNRHLVTNGIDPEVRRRLEALNADSFHVVTDSNVSPLIDSLLSELAVVVDAPRTVIPAGEEHKTLESAAKIWQELSDRGATRNSVVINIGGGVVSDLGGFAASVFKRGIRHVNFTTTLLGAVDASIGGKTGIDFAGCKNEIGTFSDAEFVWLDTRFLETLPHEEIVSGYAEMVKTAIIDSPEFVNQVYAIAETLPEGIGAEAIERCMAIKGDIVRRDFRDTGLRNVLNFGHTFGHALESLSLERGKPMSHGAAVAHGMGVAMILGNMLKDFPPAEIHRYFEKILKPLYKKAKISCDDYPALLAKMKHDKKNSEGAINFVIPKQLGAMRTKVNVPEKDIFTAIDIYRDMTGQ